MVIDNVGSIFMSHLSSLALQLTVHYKYEYHYSGINYEEFRYKVLPLEIAMRLSFNISLYTKRTQHPYKELQKQP